MRDKEWGKHRADPWNSVGAWPGHRSRPLLPPTTLLISSPCSEWSTTPNLCNSSQPAKKSSFCLFGLFRLPLAGILYLLSRCHVSSPIPQSQPVHFALPKRPLSASSRVTWAGNPLGRSLGGALQSTPLQSLVLANLFSQATSPFAFRIPHGLRPQSLCIHCSLLLEHHIPT